MSSMTLLRDRAVPTARRSRRPPARARRAAPASLALAAQPAPAPDDDAAISTATTAAIIAGATSAGASRQRAASTSAPGSCRRPPARPRRDRRTAPKHGGTGAADRGAERAGVPQRVERVRELGAQRERGRLEVVARAGCRRARPAAAAQPLEGARVERRAPPPSRSSLARRRRRSTGRPRAGRARAASAGRSTGSTTLAGARDERVARVDLARHVGAEVGGESRAARRRRAGRRRARWRPAGPRRRRRCRRRARPRPGCASSIVIASGGSSGRARGAERGQRARRRGSSPATPGAVDRVLAATPSARTTRRRGRCEANSEHERVHAVARGRPTCRTRLSFA